MDFSLIWDFFYDIFKKIDIRSEKNGSVFT